MLEKYNNKNFLNNPYFLSALQICNSFLNIAIISLITRYYSFSTLGLIAFSQSIAGIFTTFISECFDQIIILKITKEKYNLSNIVSTTISARFILIIPIIIFSYIFIILKTQFSLLGLIMACELLKSIVPATLIDRYKETYILVLISILERIIIFISIIYLLNKSDYILNHLFIIISISGLIFIILSLYAFKIKITKIYICRNFQLIYEEIISSIKGIPNIFSKVSFIYYAKLLMGLNGLYSDLGKFSIIHKIVNVCVMPTSYYFRLCYGKLINITKGMIKKIKFDSKYNAEKNIFKILNKGLLISILNFCILILIINNEFLINKFPEILAIDNLKLPCLILFIYVSMTKFEQIFELIFIGVFGRKKLLGFYLPGSIISIILLSTIGLKFNLSVLISCFFIGHANNSFRLISKIYKTIRTNY